MHGNQVGRCENADSLAWPLEVVNERARGKVQNTHFEHACPVCAALENALLGSEASCCFSLDVRKMKREAENHEKRKMANGRKKGILWVILASP